MTLRLRNGLHYCECGGRAVFLDVPNNRYFRLPNCIDVAFKSAASGENTLEHQGVLEYLLTRNIVVVDEGEHAREAISLSPPIPSPVDELMLVERKTLLWIEGAALFSLLKARFELKIRSFAGILQDLDHRRPETEIGDRTASLARVSSAFANLSIFVRTEDQCLPRSIAFKRLCAHMNIPATLVIGVSLDPFAAHCWVQVRDRVVSDTYEHVRLFTPILAV